MDYTGQKIHPWGHPEHYLQEVGCKDHFTKHYFKPPGRTKYSLRFGEDTGKEGKNQQNLMIGHLTDSKAAAKTVQSLKC